MAPKDTRRAVAILYACCGMPFGVLSDALPLLLRSLHFSSQSVGLASLLQLGWAAKAAWAPWVDRRGSLRVWLRLFGGGTAVSLLGLSMACAQASRVGVLVAAAGVGLCAATFDLAADAALVRLRDQGRIGEAASSSLRMAAYKWGLTLGGGVCIAMAGPLGWAWPFALLALAPWACLHVAVPLVSALPPLPPYKAAAWRAQLWHWLSRPQIGWLFLFQFAFKLSLSTAAPMSRLFWADRGIPMLSAGVTMAVCGLLAATAGAGLAAVATARWGLRACLRLGTLAEVLVALMYVALSRFVVVPCLPWAFALAIGAEALTQGLTTSAMVALAMRNTSGAFAATQFGLLSAMFAVTRACGGVLGGALYAHVGPPAFFAWVALLGLPGLLVLRRVATDPAGPLAAPVPA